MLLPIDTASGEEERMGRQLAYVSANKRACVWVSVASYKLRFSMVPSQGMHANLDGDHDRPADVTAESTDVSD